MTQLLPRTHTEFQVKEYWDSFFSKRSKAFEWYGEYTDLCHVLHKYLKTNSRVLMVGCGNSRLSEDLYDAGFQLIENIDISDIVIRQMTARNKMKRPSMTYTKMDLLHMTYEDTCFDCVLDKGTLDAIFSNNDYQTIQNVEQMFAEIERVLKVAGRYVCITLAQDHILKKLLETFKLGWLLRVHKVLLGDGESESSIGGALPVFAFVLTKLARVEGRPPMKVYEHVDEKGNCVRCETIQEISEFIQNNQQYAMVKHYLNSLHVGEDPVQMDLWSPSILSEPRYTLSVVDLHKRKGKNGPFAIFIVPQGRETEWLFSSDPGRKQLAESAGFERLVIVTLHRGHTYSNLDSVKEEVAVEAVQLVQHGLTHGKQHPVLTLGDGLGSRVVLHEGSSPHSGDYVVEECDSSEGGEGVRVRRLVFLTSQHLAQTEVLMVPATVSKTSKKSKKKQSLFQTASTLDHTRLSCGHHQAFIASLAFICSSQYGSLTTATTSDQIKKAGACKESETGGINEGVCRMDILLVGLGGGALPMFLNKCIPSAAVEVVELDIEMLSVAEKWFSFNRREKMTVHINDGVSFINGAVLANERGLFDVIILDVDSKDLTSGVSSPPQAFVEDEFLSNSKLLLKDSGIFVTNMAARNKEIRAEILHSIAKHFCCVISIPIPEDINEVIVGLPYSDLHSKKDEARSDHINLEVKNRLTNIAVTVAKNANGRLHADDLIRDWMSLLLNSRAVD